MACAYCQMQRNYTNEMGHIKACVHDYDRYARAPVWAEEILRRLAEIETAIAAKKVP